MDKVVIGIDVGSTTVKMTVVDPTTKEILWSKYLRHETRQPEMTLSMLEQSAVACRGWRERGLATTVSVNVSLTSLADVGLADRLDNVVSLHGLEPADVVLEVTETAATSHLAHVLGNLSRLRMKGFGLSIDDYGTGYASMQQLARVPFTELKIDRSFVQAAVGGGSARAMLESSLEIAAKLRISAVAEGIASEEQLQLLRSLGCPLGQGNYLAEPMAADDFAMMLERRAVSRKLR